MTSEAPTPQAADRAEAIVDVTRLKALAHPLRIRMFDALSAGAATASGLAQLLGESSGATSYHLRQLAAHGFVEEVVGRGTGRERWWQIPPTRQVLSSANLTGPAARESLQVFADEWLRLRFEAAADFRARVAAGEESEWDGHAEDITDLAILTPDELSQMSEELMGVLESWAARTRGRETERPDGARVVEVQLRAFPRREAAGDGARSHSADDEGNLA
ncbi:ArsR/SmtB family transcription factor [Cellulomonas edaphi]|uniref:Winged helix-turn-helix domain-containing protein n=1 Tax=Cellulomonas edaphi TaxID=3053468 RepID=A0ABT7S6Z1_9CELL|nr:winged helix-turn-helix domain-containing protein [Cellulomons edaphi]MDM7831391.1 winged helix-turn-helix domain-containing protein [Cellulomons edaphi]